MYPISRFLKFLLIGLNFSAESFDWIETKIFEIKILKFSKFNESEKRHNECSES